MTSRRWALWLWTLGAGVCITLGAGAGVAAADTETSDGAGPSSQSDDRDAPASSDETPDQDPGDAVDSDDPSDPATVPASTELPDEATRDADDEAAREADAGQEVDTDADAATATDADTDLATAADSDATVVDEAPVQPAAVDVEPAPAPEATYVAPAPVTGVQTGRAKLTIPVGSKDYRTRADWYLPTQADGSVAATGVIWLQHGFLGNKASLSKLARTLSQQTNSIVVAPNLSSFPLACAGCWINGEPMQEAVAAMFLGDRTSLNASANTAGYLGTLPQDFVMSGQSAGGGFATAVGGYYTEDPTSNGSLRGVMMFDGFAFGGVLSKSLAKLDDPFIPVYQIAAPPQPWNSSGASTKELVAARPGQFVGVTLAGGSHADALIGGNPLFDFFAQLVAGFSPPGNTDAVYTLATGWINDMYQGLGPSDGTGIYGDPDQYIVMGDTAAIVLAPPPIVDVDSYLGTWYEVGSVKQFFSIGLVNTKAVYSLNPDGSIKVENSGNYFFNNGPESSIVGSALPVDPTNNKLNVRFFGPPSAHPPGNYWIVDLDPDYQWAIVTDPTGFSGFLLSRIPVVSADFYQQLLDRASVNGVRGWITRTRQPAANQAQL
ncbi:lipocalin family protein [Mycolicibacterium austroafricanum]|uniref:lipocalin family protein n=1 Tax=Mycolicibacterium austroafricanum TaxID=39687 RepID=UPI001CA30A56|nr:lipocalin family protein [Mycolicibacterium austroafricanum]QZT60708.1 lipocalin family protein [Mycolicibacterium austroafricanum]